MKTKHRGAVSELRAAAWLLEQGYEVFRNLSGYGEADLAAVRLEPRELILIDVKTGNYPTRHQRLTQEQRRLGVRCLLVTPDWIGFADELPEPVKAPKPKKKRDRKWKPGPDHPWRLDRDPTVRMNPKKGYFIA